MDSEIKITRKAVKNVLLRTFPTYTGKKMKLIPTHSVRVTNTQWDEGSRNRYQGVSFQDNTLGYLSREEKEFYNDFCVEMEYPLTDGIIVIQHSTFQGEDLGIKIYGNMKTIREYMQHTDYREYYKIFESKPIEIYNF